MSLESIMATYGYPALFIGTLLEGETPLLIASFLAHRGYLHLPFVILVSFFATLITDQFFFYLGRRKGDMFLRRRPRWRPGVERATRLINQYQSLIVLGFRFIYGLRTVTPFVIGLSGFSPRRFLFLNAIGAIMWSTAFACAGYALGHAVEILLADIKRFELWIVGAIALGSLVMWIIHLRSKRKRFGGT